MKFEEAIEILERNDELIKGLYSNLEQQVDSFRDMMNDPKA